VFTNEERHVRRLQKVRALEARMQERKSQA
jgi:hypothetical protein